MIPANSLISHTPSLSMIEQDFRSQYEPDDLTMLPLVFICDQNVFQPNKASGLSHLEPPISHPSGAASASNAQHQGAERQTSQPSQAQR